MNKVSIGDALAAGFHLIRRNPLAPLAWGAVYLLLFSLPVSAIAMTNMRHMATLTSNPFAGGWAFVQVFLVEVVFGLLTFGLLNAAVFRAVLSPEKSERFYLRLGADEARQALVILAIGGVMFLITFAVSFALALLGGVLAVATGQTGKGASTYVFIGLMYLLLIVVAGFVAVRFALSGPDTLAKRRFSLSASWGMTRGNVWPLIGIGAVLTVIGAAYTLTFLGISYATGQGLSGLSPAARAAGRRR